MDDLLWVTIVRVAHRYRYSPPCARRNLLVEGVNLDQVNRYRAVAPEYRLAVCGADIGDPFGLLAEQRRCPALGDQGGGVPVACVKDRPMSPK